jgi:hypothetical protein
MREYPAYGRTIASHVVRGQKPIAIAVLLSARWGYFDNAPKICIHPDEWAPGRYEFGFLGGLHAVVVPGDGVQDAQLGELLVDLMRAGPALLWAFNADGSKLYDGEDPNALTHWACELMGRLDLYKQIRDGAERTMVNAQRRAIARWVAEAERIQASSGIEGWMQFYQRTEGSKDHVRALFASSREAPGEARAA